MQSQLKHLRYFSYIASAPIVAFLTFLALAITESAQLGQAIISVVFASLIPITVVVYLRGLRDFPNMTFPSGAARIKPFVIAITGYAFGFLALVSMRAPVLIRGLMLAYMINTTAMLAITTFWKISIHAAGVTGPLSFVIFRLGLWSIFLYLLVIPVALIKLRFREHTAWQLIAGAAVTIVITWTQVLFLVPLIAVA